MDSPLPKINGSCVQKGVGLDSPRSVKKTVGLESPISKKKNSFFLRIGKPKKNTKKHEKIT